MPSLETETDNLEYILKNDLSSQTNFTKIRSKKAIGIRQEDFSVLIRGNSVDEGYANKAFINNRSSYHQSIFTQDCKQNNSKRSPVKFQQFSSIRINKISPNLAYRQLQLDEQLIAKKYQLLQTQQTQVSKCNLQLNITKINRQPKPPKNFRHVNVRRNLTTVQSKTMEDLTHTSDDRKEKIAPRLVLSIKNGKSSVGEN